MEMKKLSLIIILLGTLSFNGVAQTQKQITKSIKIFFKDNEKGIAKLEKYMSKVPNGFPNQTSWERLIDMKYLNYIREKEVIENNSDYSNITLTIEDDEEEEDKELSFAELLLTSQEKSFINACRRATTMSSSIRADYYLRILKIDFDPDTLISDKALEYFDEAEEHFENEDYELAILNYDKAIEEEPNYYAALMNAGASHFRNESPEEAITYFERTIEKFPTLMKPRNFLIDVLTDEELYVRAKKACLEAICIYPSNNIKSRYQQILYQENKYMNENRFIKNFYANNIKFEDQKDVFGIFAPYREAKDEISKFCDEDGIIEPNGKTAEVYLEVYSWKRFFEENEDETPDFLRYAKKMNQKGYLDCYLLINQYHYDIYPQTKHFLSFEANRDKVKRYIKEFLIESLDD